MLRIVENWFCGARIHLGKAYRRMKRFVTLPDELLFSAMLLANGGLVVFEIAQEIPQFAPRGIDKGVFGAALVLRILFQEAPIANAHNNQPQQSGNEEAAENL